jgi:cytoskeleton protein RodZ
VESFGAKLRSARQSRRIGLSAVADSTKITKRYLRALESHEFERLPGGVFNRGYVRAYAEFVGLDPDSMVDSYLAEERAQRARDDERRADCLKNAAAVVVETSEPAGAGFIRRSSTRVVAIAICVLALALAVRAGWEWLTEEPTVPEPASVAAPPTAATPASTSDAPAGNERAAATRRVAPPGTAAHEVSASRESSASSAVATVAEEAAARPAPAAPPPSRQQAAAVTPRLEVPEFGVGTQVVDHRLEGRATRFDEGDRVWFWTRVAGGRPGDRFLHVWSHEGVEQLSLELEIGGPSWRTQSAKRLYAGSGGGWTVEARTLDGTVLARQVFFCSTDAAR